LGPPPPVRKLLQRATLKVYPGFPHGMATTHADVLNADLLAFFPESAASATALTAAPALPRYLREGLAFSVLPRNG
jgi:hypothetical protein